MNRTFLNKFQKTGIENFSFFLASKKFLPIKVNMDVRSEPSDGHPGLHWESYLEDLLATWSNHALSYAWLHTKAESKYRKLNYWFTIPIVVLSTLGGTLNVGMSSILPADWVHYGQISVGGVGIFTGILGTLQNFFKYAQLSESHRNAGMQWYKFHRVIHTELSLDPASRRDAGECFRTCKSEMDRLLDNSPYIPKDMIDAYYATHNQEIELPDIIGRLHRTPVYHAQPRAEAEELAEFPVIVQPE
jgi:hypothetical protein